MSQPAHTPDVYSPRRANPAVYIPPKQPASRFETEFRQLVRLGHGGFGTVFKVQNVLDGKEYAVKRIRFRYHHGRLRKRLSTEVKTLALLDHPNIVRYHASWIEHPAESPYSASLLPPLPALDAGVSPSLDLPFRMDATPDDDEEGELEEDEEEEEEEDEDEEEESDEEGPGTPPERWPLSTLYIQMQLYEMTLSVWLSEPRRRFCRSDSLDIFRQVARALEYMHLHNVIHRDLKPGNVFLSRAPEMPSGLAVHVGDFGLATFVSDECSAGVVVGRQQQDERGTPIPGSSGNCSDGYGSVATSPCVLALGTPMRLRAASQPSERTRGIGTSTYASPEQLSAGVYNEKTDVYSLGLMLLELLHPPFETQMERCRLFEAARHGKLPSRVSTHLPEEASLVRRCLAHSPAERPTAAECLLAVSSPIGSPMADAGLLSTLSALLSPETPSPAGSVVVPKEKMEAVVQALASQSSEITKLQLVVASLTARLEQAEKLQQHLLLQQHAPQEQQEQPAQADGQQQQRVPFPKQPTLCQRRLTTQVPPVEVPRRGVPVH